MCCIFLLIFSIKRPLCIQYMSPASRGFAGQQSRTIRVLKMLTPDGRTDACTDWHLTGFAGHLWLKVRTVSIKESEKGPTIQYMHHIYPFRFYFRVSKMWQSARPDSALIDCKDGLRNQLLSATAHTTRVSGGRSCATDYVVISIVENINFESYRWNELAKPIQPVLLC